MPAKASIPALTGLKSSLKSHQLGVLQPPQVTQTCTQASALGEHKDAPRLPIPIPTPIPTPGSRFQLLLSVLGLCTHLTLGYRSTLRPPTHVTSEEPVLFLSSCTCCPGALDVTPGALESTHLPPGPWPRVCPSGPSEAHSSPPDGREANLKYLPRHPSMFG